MTPANAAANPVPQQDRPLKPPLNPYLVLVAAILLPGFGHVLNGQPKRGLIMQLFMIALAFVTWHLAPPTASFIGKLSGGLFVYALSIPEAYRVARLRWELFHAKPPGSSGAG